MGERSYKSLPVIVVFGFLVVCSLIIGVGVSSAEIDNSFSEQAASRKTLLKVIANDAGTMPSSLLSEDELQEEFDFDTYSNATKKKKKKKKKRIKTLEDGNAPNSPPIGPDLRGSWSGYIDLVGKDRESVTATVHQNGTYIVITTSSHQSYGRKFIGNIKESGFILAYDQTTGEDWTTHSGPATENRIDLYDYVNIEKHGYHDLDRLLLER
jgi:hypothetical protein